MKYEYIYHVSVPSLLSPAGLDFLFLKTIPDVRGADEDGVIDGTTFVLNSISRSLAEVAAAVAAILSRSRFASTVEVGS